MFRTKFNRQKGRSPEETFWSSYEPRRSSEGCSEGCSEGSLEQTHKSMSTPRTCKNRCDMNISYNDFDFGSRNH